MEHRVELAPYTTLRVGGPARDFLVARSAEELVRSVLAADAAGTPVFVLGGGSNTLVGDEGFDGLVVQTAGGTVSLHAPSEGSVEVTATVGCVWDDVVARCVDEGLAGLEALSGVPGQIGSAVMQNLGAYGQEVGAHLSHVLLLDRGDGSVRTYKAGELDLGYRTSMLRRSLEEGASGQGPWFPTPRWVVLEATFALEPHAANVIAHPQLARALGCEVGTSMPLRDIRNAVLEVRATKGMVADPNPEGPEPQHDRWSSGSFFTNPVLGAEEADRLLPPDAPRYPAEEAGRVKTSAAWLIEHAGFPKGYGVHGDRSAATLSTLHTLALTNRGTAQAADVVELARTVRDGVRARFGVELVPETVLVGTSI